MFEFNEKLAAILGIEEAIVFKEILNICGEIPPRTFEPFFEKNNHFEGQTEKELFLNRLNFIRKNKIIKILNKLKSIQIIGYAEGDKVIHFEIDSDFYAFCKMKCTYSSFWYYMSIYFSLIHWLFIIIYI